MELLRALAAAKRGEDLWMLCDALVRADILPQLPDDLRPTLLDFLARRAGENGPHSSVLGELVDNDDWVGDDVDALALLLFLAVRTDKGRVVLFRRSRQLAGLEASRPWLFDLWLRPRLRRRVPARLDDAELAKAWRAGHDTACDWEREIQKRTCVCLLAFAEDYQRAIRAHRRTCSRPLPRLGSRAPQLEPEEFLEEIRVEHDLPRVK